MCGSIPVDVLNNDAFFVFLDQVRSDSCDHRRCRLDYRTADRFLKRAFDSMEIEKAVKEGVELKFDDSLLNEFNIPDNRFANDLVTVAKLAYAQYTERQEAGKFDVTHEDERKFIFGPDGWPTGLRDAEDPGDVDVSEGEGSHVLVEQCMVLANRIVGQR